jgi:hypothetical protein
MRKPSRTATANNDRVLDELGGLLEALEEATRRLRALMDSIGAEPPEDVEPPAPTVRARTVDLGE